MKRLFETLRTRPLLWWIPLVLVPLALAVVAWYAWAETRTPDSPFIYDI